MKKKTFLGAAMLLICSPSYGVKTIIKPGSDFYADAMIFGGLAVAFVVVIVSGVMIRKKLWKKQ
jgi:hypothetical protein